MDRVARHLEEWGTLSISGPIVSETGEDFRFDLDLTDRELYEANRLEGAVSLRRARALDARVSVRIENTLDNVLGNLSALQSTKDAAGQQALQGQIVAGLRNLAGSPEGQAALQALLASRPELVGIVNAFLGATTAGAGDQADTPIADGSGDEANEGDEGDGGNASAEAATPPEQKLVEGEDFFEGRAAKAVGGFSDMLGQFEGDLTMNQRRRIRLTASDSFELGLHKFFSDPKGLPKGYDIVFVAFTVSCHPGWRTSENFVGQVDVRVSVEYPGLEAERDHLLVAGVYPAFNSQELNLRSSRRELITISGQLALAGQFAGAKLFMETADKFEQDAETNTGLAVVNSYANGGRHFGYEFRPTFRALKEPASRHSGPGYRLEPKTFPAVAIVLVPTDWIKGELKREKAYKGRPPYKDLVDDILHEIAKENLISKLEEKFPEGFDELRLKKEDKSTVGDRFKKAATDEEKQSLFELALPEYLDNPEHHADFRKSIAKEYEELDSQWKAMHPDPRKQEPEELLLKKRVSVMVEERFDELLEGVEVNFYISHSWRPINEPACVDWPLIGPLARAFQKRLSEQEMIEQSLALDGVRQDYIQLTDPQCNCVRPTDSDEDCDCWRDKIEESLALIDNRWNLLQAQALNLTPYVTVRPFDSSSALAVASLSPRVGTLNRDSSFVIRGHGFKKRVRGRDVPLRTFVEFDNKLVQVPDKDLAVVSDQIALVTIDKGLVSKARKDYTFRLTADGERAWTPAFELKSSSTPASTHTLQIGRKDGHIDSLKVPKDIVEKQRKEGLSDEDFARFIELLKQLGPECCGDGEGAKVDLQLQLQAESTENSG